MNFYTMETDEVVVLIPYIGIRKNLEYGTIFSEELLAELPDDDLEDWKYAVELMWLGWGVGWCW